MKFDMGEAWNEALAMLKGNRDLMLVVSGVFFFLPYLALLLMMPNAMTQVPVAEPGSDPQVALDALMDLYARILLPLTLVILAQSIGSLTLLALLRDASRPTLGQALKLGLIAFLPYLAAQLIAGLALGLVGGLLVALAAATGSVAAIVLVFLVVLVVAFYIGTKFSLLMPVLAVERVYNPITALVRSWKLTKGNSLRLFLFYFLVILVGTIVSMIIGIVFGLLFAVAGEQGAVIGNGVVSSLVNAVFAVVMLAVVAAAHRQLAGDPAENLRETFE